MVSHCFLIYLPVKIFGKSYVGIYLETNLNEQTRYWKYQILTKALKC